MQIFCGAICASGKKRKQHILNSIFYKYIYLAKRIKNASPRVRNVWQTSMAIALLENCQNNKTPVFIMRTVAVWSFLLQLPLVLCFANVECLVRSLIRETGAHVHPPLVLNSILQLTIDCSRHLTVRVNMQSSWTDRRQLSSRDISQRVMLSSLKSLVSCVLVVIVLSCSKPCRGGSSRRAAGLQPSLKNLRQKIPPNGQTLLKFGFSYENFTTQSFSVLPTPFWLNVS